MARPKNLLEKVATRPNLQKAWQDISRDAWDYSHGASEQTIQDFRSDLKSNLDLIRTELLGGKYKFGQHRGVIKDKKRLLRISDIRDRVVQRAMAIVLEKSLSQIFNLNNPASFAYLPKKGIQPAIKQMLKYYEDGCNYILEADIIKFFDTVDQDKLLNKIYPQLQDRTLDILIKEVFEMEIGNKQELEDEDWTLFPEGSVGLPQGGYLSPLFSNIYLSEFDKEMLKEHFRLIRYADDFIVMCKSKAEAAKAHDLSRAVLGKRLGLKLHRRNDKDEKSKTRIINVKNKKIRFLGVEFDGVRIVPDPKKRVDLSSKLLKIGKKSRNVSNLLTFTKNLLEGWVAAYAFTDINEKDLTSIENEVNKMLWQSLYVFGWKLRPKDLSEKQRLNSGVNPIGWHINKIRAGFRNEDRELLAKYWTKANSH